MGEPSAPRPIAHSLAKDLPSSPIVRTTNIKGEFQPLFNGKDLTRGWNANSEAARQLAVDSGGVLIGSGPKDSHLYSERGAYKDFHLRVTARINNGGNSGVFVRASTELARPANNPRWPDGYEAQINSTHWNQDRTGVFERVSTVSPSSWSEIH